MMAPSRSRAIPNCWLPSLAVLSFCAACLLVSSSFIAGYLFTDKHVTSSESLFYRRARGALLEEQKQPTCESPNPARTVLAARNGTTLTRGLVVAMHLEDISWILTYFPSLRVFAYSANDTLAVYHQREPWGKEAGAFLTFIVDYYDRLDELPDLLVFIHAHRFAYHTWHQDAVIALSRLRWDAITHYTSLNVQIYHQKEPGYHNFDYIYNNWDNLTLGELDAIARTVSTRARDTDKPRERPQVPPGMLECYCCAQFVVPKALLRLRSRRFFVNLRDSFVYNAARRGQADIPRVLEHMWHMIFGEHPRMTAHDVCKDVFYCDDGDWHGAHSGSVRRAGLG